MRTRPILEYPEAMNIWSLWENGSTGEASAVAVLLVVLVAILSYFGTYLQDSAAGQDARVQ